MDQIPRIRFAQLPTSIEPLERLSKLFNGPVLKVKRDDQTGLAFGGNKTRKLEFLVAEALSHGAEMLITAGAAQSNHCRQTAAAAAHAGLRCTLVLTGTPPHRRSGNLLLDHLLGAELVWTSREDRDRTLDDVYQQAWQAGKRPYLIPYGGSNSVGACGYVFAINELMHQGFVPDWIVFPSSSGGTQAGLVTGAIINGFQGKILGISVDESESILQKRISNLARQTAEFIGETIQVEPEEILVNDHYLGGGYGVVSEMEKEAIRLFASQEGLLLDPVYTGRAAAGLLDLIEKKYFQKNDTVLFWHTGGTPALFADQYLEMFE